MSRSVAEARILILNYNGRGLMAECLPSILEAASASRRQVRVTVIDNKSTDDSVEFLRREFPSADIFEAPVNRILCTYNDALRAVSEPIAILLNNDIKVDRGFVDPLLDAFERDDTLFAAGSKCLDFDGRGFQGEKSIGGIRWGLFWTDSRYPGYEADVQRRSWTVQVALGAFDRAKFLAIGGYDDLYLPGTWEDTDISLKAYRRGWHCTYEPASVIYHKGQVSFHREFGKSGSSVIAHRNTFLFFWKNFSHTRHLAAHLLFVPVRLLRALVTGNVEFLKGFVHALGRAGSAFAKAPGYQGKPIRSDAQILAIFSERAKTT